MTGETDVGVFAVEKIPAGFLIPIPGFQTIRMNQSSLVDRESENPFNKRQLRGLEGPLGFANHACSDANNARFKYVKEPSKDGDVSSKMVPPCLAKHEWALWTTKVIQPGEEVLVCYGPKSVLWFKCLCSICLKKERIAAERTARLEARNKEPQAETSSDDDS